MSDVYSSPDNSENLANPSTSDPPEGADLLAEPGITVESSDTIPPLEEQATVPIPLPSGSDSVPPVAGGALLSTGAPLTSGAPGTTTQPAPITEPATVAVGTSTPGTRRLGMTLALIALLFALLGGGLLLAGYNTANAELQPARVAQAYCTDLQAQQFAQAYALLSSSYQEQVTKAQFTLAGQLQEQVDGRIRGCPTATGPGIDLAFGQPKSHVAFLITILRSRPFQGHIELIRQQGTWKVQAIEQSLAGTNIAPLVTASTFCSAIIKGDYAAAYNTLSSRQQSIAPESQFAQQLQSAFGGAVRLNSCTLDFASYHVQVNSAAVAMTFNLTISMSSTGSLTTGLVSILNLRLESGGWKLDDFTPEPAGSA
jgi:hypothetical protein